MVSFSFHYSSFFRSAFSLMWLPGLVGRSETRLNLQLSVTYWVISSWCGLRVFDGRVNMDSDVWENNPKMFPMCQWLSSPVRLKWVRHDDNDVCKVNSLTKVTLSGVIIHRSPAFPFPLEVGGGVSGSYGHKGGKKQVLSCCSGRLIQWAAPEVMWSYFQN